MSSKREMHHFPLTEEDICFLSKSKKSDTSEELPSSLRERIDNTKDFDWGEEDYPFDEKASQNLSSSLRIVSPPSSLLNDSKPETLENISGNNPSFERKVNDSCEIYNSQNYHNHFNELTDERSATRCQDTRRSQQTWRDCSFLL